MAEEYIESPAARGTRPFPALLLALQALLIAVVVGWVLDLYRPAGFNFYTEQMLLAVTGLALASASSSLRRNITTSTCWRRSPAWACAWCSPGAIRSSAPSSPRGRSTAW
jgi:hypothetical protein